MIVIKLDKPEGNSYNIIAVVRKILIQIHGYERGRENFLMYQAEATSGDYEHLKETSLRYCNGLNSEPRLIFAQSDDVVEVVDPSVLERNQWWKQNKKLGEKM